MRKKEVWTLPIIRIFLLVLPALLTACRPGGPATTNTNSSAYATVAERTKFLNRYISFRRTYKTLDFDIMYQNNDNGRIPGPSDWDVRLVATVPASELPAWVPAGVNASSMPNVEWLKSVPMVLDLSGVSEWYVENSRIVGLDRVKHIVVCRLWSN